MDAKEIEKRYLKAHDTAEKTSEERFKHLSRVTQ